jgi:hypothetical protein
MPPLIFDRIFNRDNPTNISEIVSEDKSPQVSLTSVAKEEQLVEAMEGLEFKYTREEMENFEIRAEDDTDGSGNDPAVDEVRPFDDRSGRAFKEAQDAFVRKDGIVYVPAESWIKYRSYAVNCHLYVASKATATPSLGDEDRDPKEAKKRSLNSRSPSPVARTPLLEEPTVTKGEAHVRQQLPEKFRFINEHLMLEIAKIIGVSAINFDHVAPFRSIIPYEKSIRQVLEEKEKEWGILAASDPKDPAVLRTETWIPGRVCYGLSVRYGRQTQSNLDRIRILLDGLRSFVYFLDHDLAELVATYRKIQSQSIEKIAFAHLWYLFEPGQEIVIKKPNYQVYRVLQVTGGRKSLVGRGQASKSSSRRTVSNLAIDCFYLDFDGKHLRPVPKVIYIHPYDDLMAVTSLEEYPFCYEKEKSKDDIINRGKKFTEVIQVTHRKYCGLSLKDGDLFDRYEEVCISLFQLISCRTNEKRMATD